MIAEMNAERAEKKDTPDKEKSLFVVRYVVRTKIRHKQAIQNIDKNTAYPAVMQDMRCLFVVCGRFRSA